MKTFPRRVTACVSGTALLLAGTVAAHAEGSSGASQTVATTAGVTGSVHALASTGSSVIVGGDFTTTVTPAGDERAAGSLAKFDPATGTFDSSWNMTVDGDVRAIAVSGDAVYIGGSFSTVNGQSRGSLAAVSLSTGALLPWAPRANRIVEAVAVAGDYVYVGGSFTSISDASGSGSMAYLARVSRGGVVDRPWSAAATPGDVVNAIEPAPDGSALYVGGGFGRIASTSVPKVARITTGASPTVDRGFKAGPTNGSKNTPVFGLSLSGNSLLVSVGGSGGGCALLDATTGATQWNFHTNGNVEAAAFVGPYAYCGGHFGGATSVGGQARYKLMAVDVASGRLSDFAPRLNSALGVHALAGTSAGLFVGGDFTKVDQKAVAHFATFPDIDTLAAPASPDLVKTHAADGRVFVDWNIPSTDGGAKVKRYDVYRSTEGGTLTKVASTTTTNLLDTMVTNGTTYCYAVSANNSVGSSGVSTCSPGRPAAGLASPPSAPLAFGTAPAAGVILLDWSAPAWDGGKKVDGYTVYRGTTPGQLTAFATLGGSSTSYSDRSIRPGTRYYYAVTASNAQGESVKSSQSSAASGSAVPGAPTLSGTAAARGIVLEWVPAADGGASPIKKFVIIKNDIRLGSVADSDRSFTDTDVQSGVTYEYRIKALNSEGASPLSDRVKVEAR